MFHNATEIENNVRFGENLISQDEILVTRILDRKKAGAIIRVWHPNCESRRGRWTL